MLYRPASQHFSQQKRNGFTIIELIVVVAISIILVGSALAGFLQFGARQQVISDAKDVQQLIRSAITRARVQDTPDNCDSDGHRLQGYRIYLTSKKAELYAMCGNDNLSPTPTSGSVLQSVSLVNTTITLDGGTLPQNYYFYTLHRGTNFSTEKILQFSDSTNEYCFMLGPSGSISEVTDVGCSF